MMYPAMRCQARYEIQLLEFKREAEKDVLAERRARAMKEGENIRCDEYFTFFFVSNSCLSQPYPMENVRMVQSPCTEASDVMETS